MKYTVIDCPGVERYEVAKFFWLEDAFEYHVAHSSSELLYNGEKISNLSLDDRIGFTQDANFKSAYLELMKAQCAYADEREWKRTHPQPWEGQPIQPPPMKGFGDPNWYQQSGTLKPQYRQYVTTGDSGMKSSMETGGPNTIAST